MERLRKTLVYWSEKYSGKFQIEAEPFEGVPISSRSTFLYSYSASPMVPCSMDYSGWYHMPDAFDLASYLRYMMFPIYFAWALDIDQHLNGRNLMLPMEELLEKVDPDDMESCEAMISRMRDIIGLLDEALAAKNDNEAFQRLKAVEARFNNDMGNAGGWSFEIRIYDNPAQVGEQLLERYDPNEWVEKEEGDEQSEEDFERQFEDDEAYEKRQRSEMKSICENAAKDPQKGMILLRLMKRSHLGED